MTQEDIINMRDKNCPDWLCDPPTEEYLLKKIAKLEAEIKQLQNTSSDSDCAKCKNQGHDLKGSWEYRQCNKCGEYVAVG